MTASYAWVGRPSADVLKSVTQEPYKSIYRTFKCTDEFSLSKLLADLSYYL